MWKTGLLVAFIGTHIAIAAETQNKRASLIELCVNNSENALTAQLPQEIKNEFYDFVSQKSSPAHAFSEALAFRRSSQSKDEKLFAEYWISLALLKAKMIHVAHAGFSNIASIRRTPKTTSLQVSALNCLNQIYWKYPSIPYPQIAMDEFVPSTDSSLKDDAEVIWQAAEIQLEMQLSDAYPKDNTQSILKALEGSQGYHSLALGVLAARQGRHRETLQHLEKLISSETVNQILPKAKNQIRLLLSRAYYSLGQYENAISQLSLISKSSNELATALSELAWSYLMAEHYSEAIGTGFSLQAGGLRHTFAPEAAMVMAMALNEICQFPESLKTIHAFKKNYEKTALWLGHWMREQKASKAGLYTLAVQFLRKQGKSVPDRIASEWVRSPFFIASQDEINLLLDEETSSGELGRSAVKEQRAQAAEIKILARQLTRDIKEERSKLTTYVNDLDILSPKLQADIATFRKKVSHFKRFRAAASMWRTILAKHQKNSAITKSKLLDKINQHLADRTVRMAHQLEEIAENNEFIEVEIFNGASQDVIWQNAHPDYKEIAAKISEEQEKTSKEKVWNWGKAGYGITEDNEDAHEVWEDELGSFKVDLYDNCSSKDRYLSIKMKR